MSPDGPSSGMHRRSKDVVLYDVSRAYGLIFHSKRETVVHQ